MPKDPLSKADLLTSSAELKYNELHRWKRRCDTKIHDAMDLNILEHILYRPHEICFSKLNNELTDLIKYFKPSLKDYLEKQI